MLKRTTIAIFIAICGLFAISASLSSTVGESVQVNTGRKDFKEYYKLRNRILSISDTNRLKALSDSLGTFSLSSAIDSGYKARMTYLVAVSNYMLKKYSTALRYFEKASLLLEQTGERDTLYMKALYNVAWTSNATGNSDKIVSYLPRYLEVARKLFGELSEDVEDGYSFLIGAYCDIMDYSNFELYTRKSLHNLEVKPLIFGPVKIANLYTNIGAGYSKMGDYAKAARYFELAESIREDSSITRDEDYITLLNDLAIAYGKLNIQEKENAYYLKGINFSKQKDSYAYFNLCNSFALSLDQYGKTDEGEKLLRDVMNRARTYYKTDHGRYIEFLNDYAKYIGFSLRKPEEGLKYFSVSLDYIEKHPENKPLKRSVKGAYARMLFDSGDLIKAMSVTQGILFNCEPDKAPTDIFVSPHPDSITADKYFIDIMGLKYEILKKDFEGNHDIRTLEAAASAGEYIISVIERMRVNISEESSRFILGNNYRNFYPSVISDYSRCYKMTGGRKYLEKAFAYAEKSKVAGLLTATREMNAIDFKIPKEAGDLEKFIQSQILYTNYRIAKAEEKAVIDRPETNRLKAELLSLFRRRDSLVTTFEKDYPEYYAMKYDTRVPSMKEIPSIIGRKNNYLNYVVSDSMVYIFVVNNKHCEVETIRIDTGFISNVRRFRELLSDPVGYKNARKKFEEFQKSGFDLYSKLIKPVEKYFCSDNITIAPENVLSYIPFETLLTGINPGEDLFYRDLNYLMDKFNISYTYSATFTKETVTRMQKNDRSLVAFAPYYTEPINADSMIVGRQVVNGLIFDLPEARHEAEYVAGITGGKAYLFNQATETEFKKVAGNYDIIHLAMHTVLNDRNPMYSAMVFNTQKDSTDDRYLYTHEVYSLPLKARMVVLSSCNTGNGLLSTGEGILSLARGFLYAGSQSVVMSMWEIDDKSGTDVVKLFYDNLLKGKSKGEALRAARREYLQNASQLRSHPYYWSSLVIYGYNGRVFSKIHILPVLIISGFLILSGLAWYYFRKRRYS